MALLVDEPFDFQGWNGCMSRCTIRVFTPAAEAQEIGYVVLMVDDEGSHGTSVTNAAETIAAQVCARYHIPEDRAQFIEHYDFRGRPQARAGSSYEQTFARIRFLAPESPGERFDFVHGSSLGRPAWTHIDRDSVESLIGEPLP